MAFVNCKQFKESQAEQDKRLDALETCCDENKDKNTEQDKKIAALEKSVSGSNKTLNGVADSLNVSNDSGLTNKNGKLAVADSLAGSGLTLENGVMSVATVEITDASGKHTLGYAVDKEA